MMSFSMSILWIGVYSFFMVEWATLIGDFVGIDPIVMGLTFLAAREGWIGYHDGLSAEADSHSCLGAYTDSYPWWRSVACRF